jgi:hypothetical protein
MDVDRGRFPMCESCRQVHGGQALTWHRQVHVSAHGRQSCVDEHLAGLMVGLWEVCDTTDSCADHNGRAYVVPTPGTALAAEQFLTGLGLTVDNEAGALYFRIPEHPDQPPDQPPPDPNLAPVSSDNLIPTLHRLGQRVAAARNLLTAVTVGVAHPRILSVVDNLDEAGHALAAGMRRHADRLYRTNGRITALRVPLGLVKLAVPIWLAAAAAYALSEGSLAWMLAAALAGYGLVTWPYLRLNRHLSKVFTRRGIRRALADPTWDGRSTPDA